MAAVALGALAPSTGPFLRAQVARGLTLWLLGIIVGWATFLTVFRTELGWWAWFSGLGLSLLSSAVAAWRAQRHSVSARGRGRWGGSVVGSLLYLPAMGAALVLGTPMHLYVAPTASMVPTLAPYQLFVTDLAAYRSQEPQRGDIVLFRSPLNPKLELVKRVVALPGEVVSVRDQRAFVDGHMLDEPYLPDDLAAWSGDSAPLQVPDSAVFVLGDNRADSFDGRGFGPVARHLLRGRVLYTLPWRVGHVSGSGLADEAERP